MTLLRFTSPYLPSFDHFFENNLFDWSNSNYSSTNTTLPSVNIQEKAEDFLVEVAAPGLSKEDFKIELEQDLLTISSEKENEKETEENKRYTRKEYSYQSFSRSLSLPKTIDGEKISAKYENGILRISLPKKEDAKIKPPREISIQ